MRAGAVVLTLALATAGCGAPEAPAEPAPVAEASADGTEAHTPSPTAEPTDPDAVVHGPHDGDARLRPDLLELEPATAQPGQIVSLRFPKGTSRGVCYVLERDVGGTWDLRYRLVSRHAGTEHEPSTVPVEAPFGCYAVGLMGPGPEEIRVHRDTPPGDYRLCTSNTDPNFCAPLGVAGDVHPSDPGPPPPAPLHADARIDPRSITAEPTAVAPGGDVILRFPGSASRSTAFSLERRVDGEWHQEWWLSSDRRHQPVRSEPVEHGFHWTGFPFDDEGPDRVRIPEEATPGDYRICVAGGAHVCAAVDVRG